MVFKRPGSDYWWCDFSYHGQRYRLSTKQKTKSRAEQFEIQMRRQVDEYGELPRKAPLWREFLPRLQEYLAASSLAPKTKAYYNQGLQMLSTTTVWGMRLDAIDTSVADCLAFEAYAPASKNCALRTLRKALSMAERWKNIKAAPRIHLRREEGRSAIIDATIESQLLAHMTGIAREQFMLIQDSGMRPKEVCALRFEDIHWDRSVIAVANSKTRASTRFVPLSKRVTKMLKPRALQVGWVWPSRSATGHVTSYVLSNEFRRVRKSLGLRKDLVAYCARHSYATDLLQETGNLRTVQDSLGHADLKTVMRYTHPSQSETASHIDRRNKARAEAMAQSTAQPSQERA